MGFRLWLSYMKKIFCSFIFWISIFLTAITASFHLYYEPNASVDTVDALLLLLHLDAFRKIIPLFAAFPFAAQFAKEWKSRMFDSIIYRSNVKSYATAQTVACVVSSFLVCFLGLLLFLGYARLQKPLHRKFLSSCSIWNLVRKRIALDVSFDCFFYLFAFLHTVEYVWTCIVCIFP